MNRLNKIAFAVFILLLLAGYKTTAQNNTDSTLNNNSKQHVNLGLKAQKRTWDGNNFSFGLLISNQTFNAEQNLKARFSDSFIFPGSFDFKPGNGNMMGIGMQVSFIFPNKLWSELDFSGDWSLGGKSSGFFTSGKLGRAFEINKRVTLTPFIGLGFSDAGTELERIVIPGNYTIGNVVYHGRGYRYQVGKNLMTGKDLTVNFNTQTFFINPGFHLDYKLGNFLSLTAEVCYTNPVTIGSTITLDGNGGKTSANTNYANAISTNVYNLGQSGNVLYGEKGNAYTGQPIQYGGLGFNVGIVLRNFGKM